MNKSLLSQLILPITKRLRARQALKYLKPTGSHLDIGCGDRYLLRRSPCQRKKGLDKIYGDHIDKKIDFPSASFDYITMLAVIEHFDYPEDVIEECHRILKKGGRLIITTPKKEAENIIKLYVGKSIKKEHKQYFTKKSLIRLLRSRFHILDYRTFEFGLNQLIVGIKK